MSWVGEIGAMVVGLGGLAFGWRERGRTLEHERTIADVGGARDVLERGAVHPHRVAYGLDDARNHVSTGAPEQRDEIRDLGRDYDELTERLKVRLGPEHAATTAFAAGEAVLDIFLALALISPRSR